MNVLRQLGPAGVPAHRRSDRDREPQIRCDFLVHSPAPGAFDSEIRALGGSIHVARNHRDPVRYAAELGAVIRRGQYQVVHSHVGFFSGIVLSVARAFAVPGRIAHSHNDFSRAQPTTLRHSYERAMRMLIRSAATHTVGCSQIACESLFGPDWHARGRSEVLLYGYDFSPFASEHSRAAARRALGLSEHDFVIGHIGHFSQQKNHEFIVALAAAGRDRGRTSDRFVLIGGGDLKPAIERAVTEHNLSDRFLFAGIRSDIPALLAAFDVMILPSRWEGLGIVVLEAQAAGVPCLVSDRVPAEASVIDALVTRQAIAEPTSAHYAETLDAWLDSLDRIANGPHPSPTEALAAMQTCPFSIARNVDRVCQIYAEAASISSAL